jgi:MFS family permease
MTTEQTPAAVTALPPMANRSFVRRATWATWAGWGLDGFTNQMFPLALAGIIAALGLTTAQGGLASSVTLISAAIGGVAGGRLADRFSRVKVLMWIIVGYAVFTGLTATAQNFEQLLLWRALEGLTFGAEWPVGAALMAEYADPRRRGRTMAWLQSAWSVGWAGANVAYLLSNAWAGKEVAWRIMFLFGILPAAFAVLMRWKLRHLPTVRVERAPQQTGVFAELFGPQLRKRTILATLVGAAALGITYALLTWIPLYLSQERGLSVTGTASYIWFMIVGNWLGYVLAGHVHDRIGRRRAFTLFYAGSAISGFLFLMVAVNALWYNLLLAFVLGFFISGQASGNGALFTELFPARVRGTGAGITYNAGRVLAAFSPALIGVASAHGGLGKAIFVALLVCTALGTLFVWLLPETNGWQLD